eukprot:TRINITY_DN71428_c0_g1_i1.p1 TRINITY_DN71428_c0_g1~~TRINITY_DN71428_c0_g1_i1.p1  ORF type:complete len:278 (+),score=38.98 TRINITY_DN71428_c0_g1_i1:119-952(+)
MGGYLPPGVSEMSLCCTGDCVRGGGAAVILGEQTQNVEDVAINYDVGRASTSSWNGYHLERWSRIAQCEVTNFVEAKNYINLQISYQPQLEACIVSPEHYIVTFAWCEQEWLQMQSALLASRVVRHSAVPERARPAGQLRCVEGRTIALQGDYIEFEFLCDASAGEEESADALLNVVTGPSRLNPTSGQLEFMRVNLGRCLTRREVEYIDDPTKVGRQLVRTRWWVCLDLIRCVCERNQIECEALSTANKVPVSWVLCLMSNEEPPTPTNPTSASGV